MWCVGYCSACSEFMIAGRDQDSLGLHFVDDAIEHLEAAVYFCFKLDNRAFVDIRAKVWVLGHPEYIPDVAIGSQCVRLKCSYYLCRHIHSIWIMERRLAIIYYCRPKLLHVLQPTML